MYAGHFAAGLALRGRARNIPVAAFLIGAFLLDLLWIAFGVLWVDHTPRDDWSHSLAMGMVWATAFAVPFWRSGRAALIAMWLAVGGERRRGEVQHRQVHPVEDARQCEDGESDPLAIRRADVAAVRWKRYVRRTIANWAAMSLHYRKSRPAPTVHDRRRR
jgi:uncharacterized membrane protein (Fun14 family)